jgi:hypothetical protein
MSHAIRMAINLATAIRSSSPQSTLANADDAVR